MVMNWIKNHIFTVSSKLHMLISYILSISPLMIKHLLLTGMFALPLFLTLQLSAQVGINNDGSNPDNSAMLDVKASDKGILIPRIAGNVRDQVPSPAIGLLIYNTTTNHINYFNGSYWYQIEATFLTSTAGIHNSGGGVSINATPAMYPDSSAMLDVNYPGRGLLIPRTTPNLITSPAIGLIIYNTSTNRIEYFNGNEWRELCAVSTGIIGATGMESPIGVAINTNGLNPDPSAILDISSTNRGLLIPRLTNSQRDQIRAAAGLTIFNTSSSEIQFFNGSGWYGLVGNYLSSPSAGVHEPSPNQITWHWNTVPGAAGYKWDTMINYSSAIDMAAATSKTETGLTCNTGYTSYVWAYNACGISTPCTLTQTTSPCSFTCGQPFIDGRDGKSYNTVSIGSHCWMAQNLNVGKKINAPGSQYPPNDTLKKFCYANLESNCDIYGGLYNWNGVMQGSVDESSQGICPTGWHVPADSEWCALAYFIDNSVNCSSTFGTGTDAGGKLKSTGTLQAGTGLWIAPNVGAVDSYGFTGLPGGYYNSSSNFNDLHLQTQFWTSTPIWTAPPYLPPYYIISAYYWALGHTSSKITRNKDALVRGYSVRCVKN